MAKKIYKGDKNPKTIRKEKYYEMYGLSKKSFQLLTRNEPKKKKTHFSHNDWLTFYLFIRRARRHYAEKIKEALCDYDIYVKADYICLLCFVCWYYDREKEYPAYDVIRVLFNKKTIDECIKIGIITQGCLPPGPMEDLYLEIRTKYKQWYSKNQINFY